MDDRDGFRERERESEKSVLTVRLDGDDDEFAYVNWPEFHQESIYDYLKSLCLWVFFFDERVKPQKKL